jgi:hypothetical protein
LDYLTTHTSLSPILRGFAPSFIHYKKGALDSQPQVASDKVFQLLAHGRWFSPGTLASSITKIGRHDIAEIQILDRISLQYAPNANERKTNERFTRTIRKTHDTRTERTKRTHDTRTNESLERNHILSNDKRSWFYRSTI